MTQAKKFETIQISDIRVIHGQKNAKQSQFLTIEYRTQKSEYRRKKCKTKPICNDRRQIPEVRIQKKIENKANLGGAQIGASSLKITYYDKNAGFGRRENKANVKIGKFA